MLIVIEYLLLMCHALLPTSLCYNLVWDPIFIFNNWIQVDICCEKGDIPSLSNWRSDIECMPSNTYLFVWQVQSFMIALITFS
jgi:hypothetical protein